MSEFKLLYLFGYQGHAYVVADVALDNGFKIKGYYDKQETLTNPFNIDFMGNESLDSKMQFNKEAFFFPAVGSNLIRERLVAFIKKNELLPTVLLDSSAVISKSVKIGHSTLVAPNAVLNSQVELGVGCVVNSGALVEHECKIGDFTHVAPGAVLAGNVSLGNKVFVGANAVIKQGVVIGDNTIIGAGSVVLQSIPDGGTWVGNPAKKIN